MLIASVLYPDRAPAERDVFAPNSINPFHQQHAAPLEP
jgi:hypothetical protein